MIVSVFMCTFIVNSLCVQNHIESTQSLVSQPVTSYIISANEFAISTIVTKLVCSSMVAEYYSPMNLGHKGG